MPNTALNRTTVALLTNKSGGALVYGDVVILDNTNANGFTTTTTAGLSTRGMGVIIEPNGIVNNATGLVALGGWVPKVNLNTAATIGQFIKSHTVAGQATPHSSPQVEGDFGIALEASATPAAILFSSPNGPLAGGAGTVTATGALADHGLIVGNGGVDVSALATGTAGQVLISGGAGADPSWATRGVAVQVVSSQSGAVATGTTTIPYDDTIPQNTEGDEYITRAITPTNAANRLHIHVVGQLSHSIANWYVAALFQDATAGSLAATCAYHPTAGGGLELVIDHDMVAGTTSATTFKVRAGGAFGGTMTFNGNSGGRIFGGVMASSITITEYVP
jgi:hypothetical protein